MDNDRGLVILDLDGTLFRTETASVPAIRQAFRELQLPLPDVDEVLECFGGPTAEFHGWICSHCRPEQAPQLVALVDRLELAFISEKGELYEGVRPALAQMLEMGCQMAICSNGYPGYVEEVVRAHCLGSFFQRVRAREDKDSSKAAMVQELLGLLSARPALVVGDRRDDVEAAHRNGLRAVAVTYGYGHLRELRTADGFADTPADLPALVRQMLGSALVAR